MTRLIAPPVRHSLHRAAVLHAAAQQQTRQRSRLRRLALASLQATIVAASGIGVLYG